MNHFDQTTDHHNHLHHMNLNLNHNQLMTNNNDNNNISNNNNNNNNDPNVRASPMMINIVNHPNNQQSILMVNISNGNNNNNNNSNNLNNTNPNITTTYDNHNQQSQQQPQQTLNYQHQNSNTAPNAAIDSSSNVSYAYYTYDSCRQLTSGIVDTTSTPPPTTATATPFQVSWNKVELIEQSQSPSLTSQQSDWYHNHQTQQQQQQQSQLLTTNEQSPIIVSGSVMPTNVTTNYVASSTNFNQQQQFVSTDHQTTNIQPIEIAIVSSQPTPIQPSQSTLVAKSPTKKTNKRGTNLKQNSKSEGRPVSAYALFFRDTQASIKAESPSATFGDISKIVASKWEILAKEDKIVYKERADMEKKNYLQNLASNKAKEIALTNLPSTPSPQQQTSIDSPIQMGAIPTLSVSDKQQQATNSSELSNFETNTGPSINMIVPPDNILTESPISVDAFNSASYQSYHETQQSQPQAIHQTNTYHQHHHQNHSSALTNSLMNDPSVTNVLDSYTPSDHHHPHHNQNDHQHPHQPQQMHHSNQFLQSENIHDNKNDLHSTAPQQSTSSSFPFDDNDPFFDTTEAEQNLIDLGIDLNDFDDINLLNDANIYSPTNSSVTNSLFDVANPVVGVDPFLSSLEQSSTSQQQQQSITSDPLLASSYNSDSMLQDSYPSEMIYESNDVVVGNRSSLPDVENFDNGTHNNFLQDPSSSSMTPSIAVINHQNTLDNDIHPETTINSGNTMIMNGIETNNNLNNQLDHDQQQQQQQQESEPIICAREGCDRPTIDSSQWDREFCSEECCVRYCSDIFRNWTNRKQQQQQQQPNSTINIDNITSNVTTTTASSTA